MSKKINIKDLPDFDMAEHLPDENAVAEYLSVVLEENDPSALVGALNTIARARGMTEIAKSSGIGRESLYKALRPGSTPRFDTISKVCRALGVGFVAYAITPDTEPTARTKKATKPRPAGAEINIGGVKIKAAKKVKPRSATKPNSSALTRIPA